MSIKDNNKNYLNDIQTFLKSNGIMLFVKHNINMELKDLDGFSCFYNEYPVIVIYDKTDKRRMMFTIMHELYHLMYDENESFADKFAGSALLTIKDVEDLCPEVVKDKNYIEKNYVDTLKIICLNNFVSVRAATKTLSNYNYLLKEEIEYEKYFEEIREYIEDKNIEITIKSIDEQ
ncbi:ImmA/IrrE family metallo-endopeptidase [Brachyspira hampsonii]|nr:ImmA/IrrE family metallo-endopeptidase [Brachyspira hampsonii]ELV04516.1 hypothetical protein H263_15789 [Brachyspira hampsonii 30599]